MVLLLLYDDDGDNGDDNDHEYGDACTSYNA